MLHSSEKIDCAACGEVDWPRELPRAAGKYSQGTKLCRTCFKELLDGKINLPQKYLQDGRIVERHSEKETD